jgi:uncharacterized protein YbjT (DUF2867 family)
MRILLCGASGFIGHNLAQTLSEAGHEVIAATSGRRDTGKPQIGPVVDYNQDTTPDVWLPRVRGMDVVINAVGVLRETPTRHIVPTHETTPKALFDACAQAGVPRVIQISALGIVGSSTVYARTKLAADTHLLNLARQGQLQATVVRPSVVYGTGGASSQLFMTLARTPVLVLPGPMMRAKVQPVAVGDLAEAVSKMVRGTLPGTLLHAVGPQSLTMAELIASLRTQMKGPKAWVVPLPGPLTTLSARFGDLIPSMPWCSEALALLAQDNVADAQPFTQLLGRAPVHHSQLVATSWQP